MKLMDEMGVLDAATRNTQSLKLRLIYAVLICAAAVLLVKQIWIVVTWLVLLALVQTLNRYLILNRAAQWPPNWRDKLLLAMCAISSSFYCSISVVFWLLGGPAGQIASIVFSAAALLHIQNHSYRCAPYFWVSIAPFLVASLALIVHAFVVSLFSYMEILSLLLVGIAFGTNLWIAYNHARAQATALVAERIAAELANRAKSDFLATMSHELRTPMNGVLGGAELLRRSNPTPDQREIIETLSSAGNSLLSLLNDLLDLSKIEAGKMTVEAIAFAPRAILKDVERLWGPTVSDKGLTLNIETVDDVPETLIGDPTRLRQIMINLVSNAVKFTHAGTIDISLQANDACDGTKTFSVKVTDTGIGMDEAALAALFEPFSQADATIARRFGGSGLGTAISLQLAHLMGGSLTVTSKLGEGSCFTLNLPLVVGQNVVLAEVVEDDMTDAAGLRVLVAEDNAANRHILSRFLYIGSHDVTFTEDGAQAVQAAIKEVFDLIILDVRMPVMDGFQALESIRSSAGPNASQPIVMLSADAMPEEKARGFAMGADDYLTKPIDPRLLFSALAMASGGREVFGRANTLNLSRQTA